MLNLFSFFAMFTTLTLALFAGGGDLDPKPIIGQPASSELVQPEDIGLGGCKQHGAFSNNSAAQAHVNPMFQAPPPALAAGMGVSFLGNPLDVGYCPTSWTSAICDAGETFELQVTDLGSTWEVRVSCVPAWSEAILFAGVQTTAADGSCCDGPFATFKGCDLIPDPLLFVEFSTQSILTKDTVLTFSEPSDPCDVPEGMYFQVFVKEGPGNWGATNAVYFFGSVPPICP